MESKKQAKNYSNMHTPEAKLRNKVALFNKYSTVCSEVKFVKRGDGVTVQNCKIDEQV